MWANSFITPRTRRLAVLASTWSPMAAGSHFSAVSSTPRRAAMSANAAGNRETTEASGANGTSTGSSERSLTNRATWGRQNSGLTYQSPSKPEELNSRGAGRPTRSRNFLVPRTTITVRVLRRPSAGAVSVAGRLA